MLKVYFVDDDELIIQELQTIIDWKKYDFEIPEELPENIPRDYDFVIILGGNNQE